MSPRDRDKSSIGERLTGVHDPRDPDGLLTVDDVSPRSASDANALSATEADDQPATPTEPADSNAGDEYPTIPEHKGITS